LPDSSKKLHEVDFKTDDYKSADFVNDTSADFEAKMVLFYADFRNENSILDPPMVNRPLLENAVEDLLTRMKSKNFLLSVDQKQFSQRG